MEFSLFLQEALKSQQVKKTVQKGEHFFEMNGRAVYETATEALPKAINQVLKDTGLKLYLTLII